MRQAAQAVEEGLPVTDAVGLDAHQLHVRGVAQQLVLQVVPHAVGDGQRNDQRRHARGHAGDGDGGDHSHHGLTPLRPEVSRREKEFESHHNLPWSRIGLACAGLLWRDGEGCFRQAYIVVPVVDADGD